MPKTSEPEITKRAGDRDNLIFEILTSDKVEISDETLAYFRLHPEDIDDVTDTTRVHRFFLWAGVSVGLIAVAVSKLLSRLPLETYIGSGFEEFLVDIVFEGGVALIGAALTAYFLGILLNAQQKRAKSFRKELRRRLREEAS